MNLTQQFTVREAAKPHELQAQMTPSLVATTLGLKNYKPLGRKGDIVVILTQVKTDARGKDEPALLFANSRFPQTRHVYIPLSSLWMLVLPTMGTLPTLAWKAQLKQALMAFTDRLYGFVTKEDIYRVQDALYEFAEDLQKAPPPTWMSTDTWKRALEVDGWSFNH